MKAIKGGSNINIIGHWDPSLFAVNSASWIKTYLCKNKEEQVKLTLPLSFLNTLDSPLQASFDGITLTAATRSLQVAIEECDADALAKSGEITKKILTELPHTPISAVGINCSFEETNLPEAIFNKFNFEDAKKIDSDRYKLTLTRIQRAYTIDDDSLNLYISLAENNTVNILFNYHSDVLDTKICIAKLNKNPPEKRYQQSILFMKNIYDLELDE